MGRREKKSQGSKSSSKTLFNDKFLRGEAGRGGRAWLAPGVGVGVGVASAAAATHVVVMDHVISILVLVILDHSHRAHQLAHGHLLPGTQPGPRVRGRAGREAGSLPLLRSAAGLALAVMAGISFQPRGTPPDCEGRSMLPP